jgi:hypothetical protein
MLRSIHSKREKMQTRKLRARSGRETMMAMVLVTVMAMEVRMLRKSRLKMKKKRTVRAKVNL